jgi:hypothetical protein
MTHPMRSLTEICGRAPWLLSGQVDGKRSKRSRGPDRQPASAQGRVGDSSLKWTDPAAPISP